MSTTTVTTSFTKYKPSPQTSLLCQNWCRIPESINEEILTEVIIENDVSSENVVDSLLEHDEVSTTNKSYALETIQEVDLNCKAQQVNESFSKVDIPVVEDQHIEHYNDSLYLCQRHCLEEKNCVLPSCIIKKEEEEKSNLSPTLNDFKTLNEDLQKKSNELLLDATFNMKEDDQHDLTQNDIPIENNKTILLEIEDVVSMECKAELMTLLDEVLTLIKNEHILKAHDIYVDITNILYEIFTANALIVFALIHQKGKFQLKSNVLDMLNKNYYTDDSSLLYNDKYFDTLWATSHNTSNNDSTIDKSMMDFYQKQQRLPSSLQSIQEQDTDHDSIVNLSSSIHDSGSFLSRHSSIKKKLSHIWKSSYNSFLYHRHHISSHSYITDTTAVLCEPCTLFPLWTKKKNSSFIEEKQNKNHINEDFSPAHNFLTVQQILGLSSNTTQESLERSVLKHFVLPLEELHCMIFTVKHDEPKTQKTLHRLSSIIKTKELQSLNKECHQDSLHIQDNQNYFLVDGLSLPVGIQIIFSMQKNRLDSQKDLSCTKEIKIRLQLIWLHHFLEFLVNHPQIHRMRETQKAIALLSANFSHDETWNHIKTKDQELTWKMMTDGNALCIIEGSMNVPLFQCLSLINESDLHKNWIPFLSSSSKIHQVSNFCQILCQRSVLPWPLDDRENVMLGYAVDTLGLPQKGIIMNGTSVPDQAMSIFGLPLIGPGIGVTRLHVKFFTFQLCFDTYNHELTHAKFVVYMDPQMPYIPHALQSFIARTSAKKIFGNIQKLCNHFNESIYAQRVKENPTIYGVIKARLKEAFDNEEGECKKKKKRDTKNVLK